MVRRARNASLQEIPLSLKAGVHQSVKALTHFLNVNFPEIIS